LIDRRKLLAGTALSAAALTLPARRLAMASDGMSIRLATVKYGSLNWLVQAIKNNKLAEKAGLDLDILQVATNQAGPVALLSDEADVVVSDWTWAMRQRSAGEKLYFLPYSSALGAVMVQSGSKITKLEELQGKRLGVAGSSIDKSWLLLRAYALKTTGKDLAKSATPVFGAPPLLSEEFRSERLAAVLNFWTYSARLEGEGHRRLIGLDEILAGLGVSPPPPLVGFVWKQKTQEKKPEALKVFFEVITNGNKVLGSSDADWDAIRRLVRPKTDAEFQALIAAYRAGIPKPWTPAHTQSANALFDLLVELGDKSLVGHGTTFDPGLFNAVG
jgi:NitT/TauT family transport system substrate-binding protein